MATKKNLTRSLVAQTRAMGLRVPQRVFLDLLWAGYPKYDAWALSDMFDTDKTALENHKICDDFLKSTPAKSYIHGLKGNKTQKQKTTNDDTAPNDDPNSKEYQLWQINKELTNPDLSTQEKLGLWKLRADITQAKKDVLETDDNHTIVYMPQKCPMCKLYIEKRNEMMNLRKDIASGEREIGILPTKEETIIPGMSPIPQQASKENIEMFDLFFGN